MAKLSVARINYIIANINDFEPLTYITTATGASPDNTLWVNRTIYLKPLF